MPKSISTHTIQLVTYSTHLPIAEVIERLDQQIAKDALRGAVPGSGSLPSTVDQFEKHVNGLLGPSGFMFFHELRHGRWFQLYAQHAQEMHLYTIGNPLIAQTLFSRDIHAGLNVPIRLFVVAKPDGQVGTEVVYHLPSSLIASTCGNNDSDLNAIAQALDAKLEALVRFITDV
ncbi:DUF302 domain-containing protein [Mycena kentingensis (nom. inval.)]|nr:DUF302 domain-containing protein [Mycena kentingensis (nom. inval.)]